MKPFKINGFNTKFAVIKVITNSAEKALNTWLAQHDLHIIREVQVTPVDENLVIFTILYQESSEI